jgi:poly(A) polymerase
MLKDSDDLYLVGGAVRDFAFGIEPYEFDFISRQPYKSAKAVANKLGRRAVKLGKGAAVIYRIPFEGGSIDFSAFTEAAVDKNLGKRDFTINSLGVHMKSLTLFDPSKGIADLHNKILRKGYDNSFSDDPLRIVKAYRMKALYPALKWDDETRASCRKQSPGINNVPPERVQLELAKMLNGKTAAQVLRDMKTDNVLFAVFPGLEQIENIQQSSPHKSDVMTHTLEMMDLFDETMIHFAGSSVFHHSGTDLMKLRLAILFHDSGKAKCFSKDKKGIHFYGHEKESALTARKSLSRLRFSNAAINDICVLCGLHLRPLLLHGEGSPTLPAKRRLIRDAGENIHLLMILSLLDFSSMERTPEELESYWNFCQEIFDLAEKEGKKILHPPKLISGLKALVILGLEKPGPELGKALIALADAQTDGAVNTPEEAAGFLKRYRKEILKN